MEINQELKLAKKRYGEILNDVNFCELRGYLNRNQIVLTNKIIWNICINEKQRELEDLMDDFENEIKAIPEGIYNFESGEIEQTYLEKIVRKIREIQF